MRLAVLPADSGRCLRWLLLALLFLGLTRPAAASHLRGGEARYRYLDATGTTPGRPFRYELTFSVYYNCDGTSSFPCGRALIGVSVFAKTTGLRIDDVTNLSGIQQLDNCPQVTQPTSSLQGYSVMYSENARNNNVTNIAFGSSGASPQVLQIDIPRPTAAYINTSPVFSDSPVPLICSVDTVTIINNAFDAEGDRLLYSFYAPFGSPANLNTIYVAPAPVSYNPRYSFSAPFGPGGYATINTATGQTLYYVPNPGEYVVGVQVTESRTIGGVDVVLSSIYREIQLQVKQCGIPGLPTFPPPTLAPAIGQSISIAEGESIDLYGTV